MIRLLNNSVVDANSCIVMETGDHSKNGASPKSQTIRGIILFTVGAIFFASCSTAKIYTKPDALSYTMKHRTIAIVAPTKTVIPTKYTDKLKATVFSATNPVQIQEDMTSQWYQFVQKRKMRIEVQNVEKTNRILAEFGYPGGDGANMSPEELAEILGVDAVLFTNCQLTAYKNVGGGVSMIILGIVGTPLIFGPAYIVWGIIELTTVHEGNEVVMKLYDGKTGDLLWNYNNKFIDKNAGGIMKTVGKTLPYYGK
jgi:hypothetical protein